MPLTTSSQESFHHGPHLVVHTLSTDGSIEIAFPLVVKTPHSFSLILSDMCQLIEPTNKSKLP